MATFKVIYRNNGLHLRITHNRKKKYRKLFDVEEEYWDGNSIHKSHPRSNQLNIKLSSELTKYRERDYELSRKGHEYVVDDILNTERKSTPSIVEACRSYKISLRDRGKYRAARKFQNLEDKLEDYNHKLVSDMNVNQMKLLQEYIMSYESIRSATTVNRYMKMVKTFLKSTSLSHEEAQRFKPINGVSVKVKLDRDEFERWKQVNVEKYALSKDIFSALIYAWGCRVGDMLRMQPIHDHGDVLIYIEQKTRKEKRVTINKEFRAIISKWEGKSKYYLFPCLTMLPSDPKEDMSYYKHIQSKTAIINNDLKVVAAIAGIDKRVTTHIARHTFATWALKRNIPSHQIKDLLNHSKFSTTEDYIRELKKDDELSDAARTIFE